MSDWARDPAVRGWVEQVLDGMAPKLEESQVAISLVTGGGLRDVKFWVELGASICMDKPIIVVVFGDTPIPAKLEGVADEIVRLESGADAEAAMDLTLAIRRVVSRIEGGGPA